MLLDRVVWALGVCAIVAATPRPGGAKLATTHGHRAVVEGSGNGWNPDDEDDLGSSGMPPADFYGPGISPKQVQSNERAPVRQHEVPVKFVEDVLPTFLTTSTSTKAPSENPFQTLETDSAVSPASSGIDRLEGWARDHYLVIGGGALTIILLVVALVVGVVVCRRRSHNNKGYVSGRRE